LLADGGPGFAARCLCRPDVEPIHNRQMVVLDRSDWLAWLDLTRPEAELLRNPHPAPARWQPDGRAGAIAGLDRTR
jgi:hypothetical protein